MPKLSVVIPVYNVEAYLRQCLDSVIGQSLKSIEIIVVNDCSPDKCEEIILEYANRDARIKYIKHEVNSGIGSARNSGIKNSTGEWITFVDSDDYIRPDTFEAVLAKINQVSADIAIFGGIYFDDKSGKTIMEMPLYSDYPGETVVINEKNVNSISVTVWGKVYRLKDITDNDIKFPPRLKHEDDEFLFKYFALVEPKMVGDSSSYYYYRKRELSVMASTNSSRKDLPEILFNIYIFLIDRKILQKYRSALLERIDFYSGAINHIDSQYRGSFIARMSELLNEINPGESELVSLQLITKTLAKKTTSDQLVFLFEHIDQALNDKWYKFGQLDAKQKIKKLINFFSSRI